MPSWLIVVFIVIGSLILLGVFINLFKIIFGIASSVIGATFSLFAIIFDLIALPFKKILLKRRIKS